MFHEFSSVYGGAVAGVIGVAGNSVPEVQDAGFTPDDAHLTMLTLERDYPEWFAQHENSLDPISSTRQELLDAMASAPSPFIGGFIYNALIMRTQIAQITGRAFD